MGKKIYSQEKNKITLIIDRSGQTYLEGRKFDLKNLQKRLEYLANKRDLVHLILQADKDVRHGRVVQIMDLAKTAGVHSIIIAARWKPEKAFYHGGVSIGHAIRVYLRERR